MWPATSYLAAWRAIRGCSSFCTILAAATWVRERKCRFEMQVTRPMQEMMLEHCFTVIGCSLLAFIVF
uniref:Uncharacterized protein n=1 Tax=Vitis vinifera TaxID=29760 RepID=F6HRJ5_VITVI